MFEEELGKKIKKSTNWSGSYDFYQSTFSIGNSRVDFKFIDAPLSKLSVDFKVFEEIPGVENFPVSILIQRELDRDRAEDEMYKGYLKNSVIKYYSPLIIALVPYKGKELEMKYPSTKFTKSDLEHAFTSDIVETAGYSDSSSGILEVKKNKDSHTGIVSWDLHSIHAVVIDGQHRLYSLIKYYDEREEGFDEISVPILLLDFRHMSGTNEHITTPQIIRSIFISLNNTPKKIDPGRLILLDDHKVPSILTQELLELRNTDNSLHTENVDIRCENGKHNPIYLTGVTTLFYIINDIFLDRKAVDMTDIEILTKKTKIRSFINTVNAFISYDEYFTGSKLKEMNPATNLSNSDSLMDIFNITFPDNLVDQDISEDLDDNIDETVLFTLKPDHYELFRYIFAKEFKSVMIKIFYELSAFQVYWNIVTKLGIDNPNSDISHYLKKSAKAQEKFMVTIDTAAENKLKAGIKKLENKGSEISFSVVGQKALFRFYYKLYDSKTNDREKASVEFIKDFKQLHKDLTRHGSNKDLFDKDFVISKIEIWKGTALDFNGTLDNSINAVLRIFSLLLFFMFTQNKSNRKDLLKIFKLSDEADKKITQINKLVHSKLGNEIYFTNWYKFYSRKFIDLDDRLDREKKAKDDIISILFKITKSLNK